MFSVVAGAALVILGLSAAGLLPALSKFLWANQSCSAAKLFKTLLTDSGLISALLAGVFTGFIPCGLVYAFLAYAASTGNVVDGWLTMVAFGVGTVPLMVFTGCGASMLSLSVRTRALQIAAWCVVLTGLISIARGAGYIAWLSDSLPAGCPLCQ
jgi:sulfite exporter TauE/SafE